MGVRPVGVTLGSLSKYFPQQQIEAILRASGREGTRRRKLPTLELMYYLIALGLHASEACRSVLRRIMVRKAVGR
jgi:Insertion element 4 transposase N-terminal